VARAAASEHGGNLLALAVLALLWERQMHPYQMSQTLKQRNKDESVKLNYGSLYSVIETLIRAGLVEAAGTEQSGNRPVRTVYRITATGNQKLIGWMSHLVSTPAKEYPQFLAALSFLPVLDADNVIALLRRRLDAVRDKVRRLADERAASVLPDLFTIETDYELALLRAESTYVDGLLGSMISGALTGMAGWRTLSRQVRLGGRPTAAEIYAAFALEGVPLPPTD
jgi:DNA-binding PadR family transcriptional regulator